MVCMVEFPVQSAVFWFCGELQPVDADVAGDCGCVLIGEHDFRFFSKNINWLLNRFGNLEIWLLYESINFLIY